MLCAVTLSKDGESFVRLTHHVTILLDFYNCMSRLKLETYLKKVVNQQKSIAQQIKVLFTLWNHIAVIVGK